MNTRVSASLRNLAFLSIAAGLTFAQTPPPGTITGPYVFSELGNGTATLASLNFNADGTVNGTGVVQQGVQVSTYAVQGTYDVSSNTLSLAGPSLDTFDANGNPLLFNQVVMVIPFSGNSFATLSTSQGQTAGQLNAASQTLPTGSFQVNGRPLTPSNTSVELLNLDANGNVNGQEVTNSFGQVVQKGLGGVAIQTPTGFRQITLGVTFTDADGNPQTATETYLALATQNGVQMIQTGGGSSGLLNLSK